MSNSDRQDNETDQHSMKRDFFGGSPRKVFFKLVLLSLIVGFVMRMMDITPGTIFGTLGSYIGRTFGDLGHFMGDIGVWFGFGAAVVFPLYIFIRLWRRWLS